MTIIEEIKLYIDNRLDVKDNDVLLKDIEALELKARAFVRKGEAK